jgi:hypothetical protein
MPRGEEESARRFFGDLLGIGNGPSRLSWPNAVGAGWPAGSLHPLGAEDDFRPARKAHLALRCRAYASLVAQLKADAVEVVEAEDIAGVRRGHIFEAFGNRIELVAG